MSTMRWCSVLRSGQRMATKKRIGQSLLTASSRIEESMLCRRFTRSQSRVTISQKLIKKLRQ
ncbi:hypothetical protein I7I53_08457 [Histoplasma capsulatum var. duboisii H88]|uniref:Uncharacterized protein n=1 Tax=Ajellomyces capsulatus (strain H88) TaxID=544711 RepID=A0A8A1LFA2_AJEC8|nr:hypothetical protein I7I53_08457 [Histoplasma capsulatum var. duboisii H88]